MQKKRLSLKQIALLGPTASGKTALSIKLAKKYDCIVLSLDSLSVYKEIDIASAKPTKKERDGIIHFGIDEIKVDEEFNVVIFFELYKKAKEYALKNNKNLIIVGGTGFYLKAMMDGLSQKPEITLEINEKVQETLQDLHVAYKLLEKIDHEYANKISSNDSYRIEKWLEIYYASGLSSSEYFEKMQKSLS